MFLMTIRCVGHVKAMKPHLSKLEDRSTLMVLLGCEAASKAYQLFNPHGGKVVISHDVMFNEKAA